MMEGGIRLSSITKRFGATAANDGVDLVLKRGEIHALLGENGAGKSTLMNVLSGVYAPDEGSIFIEGEQVAFRSPWDAVRRGIGMVHQHFQLVEAFSVVDNVLLGATDTGMRLDRRGAARKIEAVGRQHGLLADPHALIWQLTVGERQKVEILKLLYRGADLLLLDEPTSMLTPAEADDLYKALRGLADAGKYVVFITHKLREVAAAADQVTVMRYGRVVASLSRGEAARSDLAPSWSAPRCLSVHLSASNRRARSLSRSRMRGRRACTAPATSKESISSCDTAKFWDRGCCR